jgi:hypothetical protein
MKGKPMLDARLESGNREHDREINGSSTLLACVYVLLVMEPREGKKLFVEDMEQYLVRLEAKGVPARSGPGEKAASPETIRKCLLKLQGVLPVRRGFVGEDKRRDFYFLDGPLPEIRIVAGDSRHISDWQSLRRVLWRIVYHETLEVWPGVEDALMPPKATSEGKTERKRASRKSGDRNGRPRMKRVHVDMEQLAGPESLSSEAEVGG